MNNIVVLSFEGEYAAEGVSEAVLKLQQEGGIKIEDMAIARRGSGTDMKVENLGHKLTGKYAGRGAGIGLLAGFLLGGPIGGAALGAAAGGLMGKFKDTGIDDDFIRELSLQIRPDSSALFLLASDADKEKVVEMLRPYKANILSTTLDDEKRAMLEAALQKEE